MSDNPKCVYIEFEYDDGTIYRATGYTGEQIMCWYKSCEVTSIIHGANYLSPKFEIGSGK